MSDFDPSERRQEAKERANAKLRDLAKRDLVTRRIVTRTLMSTPDGRRYIWNQLSVARVFAQTFTSEPGGALITAFAEGRRSLGLALLADVSRWCPNEYVTMTRENSPVEFEEEEDERAPDTSA